MSPSLCGLWSFHYLPVHTPCYFFSLFLSSYYDNRNISPKENIHFLTFKIRRFPHISPFLCSLVSFHPLVSSSLYQSVPHSHHSVYSNVPYSFNVPLIVVVVVVTLPKSFILFEVSLCSTQTVYFHSIAFLSLSIALSFVFLPVFILLACLISLFMALKLGAIKL